MLFLMVMKMLGIRHSIVKIKLIGSAERLSRSKREKLIMDGFNFLVKSNQSPCRIYVLDPLGIAMARTLYRRGRFIRASEHLRPIVEREDWSLRC